MSRSISLLLFSALLASSTLSAQTSRGTISGLVSDQSGAVIGGAKVTLTNVEQNAVRATESTAAGVYRFDAVDPGVYRLAVTLGGFKTYSTSGFPVSAAQSLTQDVKLEVGDQAARIEVTADAVQLQSEAPVRGGNIAAVSIAQLPMASRNPVSLSFTLPGVNTQRGAPGGGTSSGFSVNGTRGRSNNFLLDGTENNDISVAGQAFQVTNPDAVAEVSVQTTNYDSEFGRAGGAVVNIITRSGTNVIHGTANYLVESTRLNAITSTQSLNPDVQRRGHPLAGTDQWFSGTIGAPIVKNRTFIFGAWLEERSQSARTVTLTTLSEPGKATLRGLFPQGKNANVDTYLSVLGSGAATGQFSNVPLGNGRPDLQIGTYARGYAFRYTEHQPIVKIDHRLSDKSQLSGRFAISDQKVPASGSINFDGFDTPQSGRYINALVSHTYIFSPTMTNELRLPYNRITLQFPDTAASPLGKTAPQITIQSGSSDIGIASNIPQGRIANNYGIQDTVTMIKGRHTFRAGADILGQRAKQAAPFNVRGTLVYNSSTGYSSWANFIDDFGGSNGSANRDFGSPNYYPNLYRQAYFGQDRWRVSDALTVTMGLRYEYFGLPMNSVRTPAFTGLFNVDPVTLKGPYSEPNSVQADKNNFAPSVGMAWSPSVKSGPLAWVFGDKKGVIRAGYHIGYDSFFNNIASNAQASSPNLVSTSIFSATDTANPRGRGNLIASFPTTPRPLSPLDAQTLMLSNLVNPYYQKWSFGIQREVKYNTLIDISYVGTKGTRLFINEDYNPLVPPAFRIRPANTLASFVGQGRLDDLQGGRTVRTNGGNSNYSGLQVEAKRRFTNGLAFTGAYTYSKAIDNGSEVFAATLVSVPSLPAIPAIFGGQARERSTSLFDRTQRAVLTFVYDLPFLKAQKGMFGRVLGGWQLSGVTTFEAGVPFTILNGVDADGLGGNNDRPDINPAGQAKVRAAPNAASPTGYVNPDAGNAPIDPAVARFVALPACNLTANPRGCRTGNAGRNTERSPGLNNWNVNFVKRVKVNERFAFEFRTEMFNLFNHPQYGASNASAFSPSTGTIQASATASAAGRFLNYSLLDGGSRVVRFQLKLMF